MLEQDSFLNPKSQDQYQRNLQTLAAQVEKLTDALKKQKSGQTSMRDSIKLLEVQQLNSQLDGLNNTLFQKQMEIEQLNLKLKVLDQAYLESNLKLQEITTDRTVLQNKAQHLEGQVNSQQQTLQQQNAQIQDLNRSKQDLIDQVQSLKDDMAKSEKKQKQNSALSADNASKEADTLVKSLKKQLEDCNEEIESLKFSKKFANDEWAKCRADLEYQRKENEALKRDVGKNIRNSAILNLQDDLRFQQELESKYEEELTSLRKQIVDKDKTINYLKDLIHNQTLESQNQSQVKENIEENHYQEIYKQCQGLLGELQTKDKIIGEQENLMDQLKDKIRQLADREQTLVRENQILRDKLEAQPKYITPSTVILQPSQPQNMQTYRPMNVKYGSPHNMNTMSPDAASYLSPQRQMTQPSIQAKSIPQHFSSSPNLQIGIQGANPNKFSFGPQQVQRR